MIERPRLKNAVIFIQTILSFVLSRKIIIIWSMYKRWIILILIIKEIEKDC